MNWRRQLLLAGAVTTAWCADIDSAAVLSRVRDKVITDAKKIPRYVCRQKIERREFVRYSKTASGCGTLDGAGRPNASSGFRLLSADRANLDVMLAEGTELFSWPGGHRFDAANPGDLLASGMAGSGDFASFLIDIFSLGRVTFQYQGACGDSCISFGYDVPVEASHYVLETPFDKVTVAYHGTFDVDTRTADLVRMMILPVDLRNKLKDVCAIRTRMTYARMTMQSVEFMIPAETEKGLLLRDGSYFENRISYESCQQYKSESVLTFGDDSPNANSTHRPKAPPAPPLAGTELQLRLVSKINSETDSAGDALEATLLHGIPNTQGQMIAAGTIVRGHVAQLQRLYAPRKEIIVAIRFDTIVLGDTPVRLTLEPTGKRDQRGRGVFVFPGDRVVVSRYWVSRWLVRSSSGAE